MSEKQTSPLALAFTVTAQQSRFHVDATADPASKNIEIKDLSISVGQKEVLAHAELKLQSGVHYVLSGRNGTGKSTLLRALGEGRVPGVAGNLRILLLGQTSGGVNEIEGEKEETVLQHVVRSDQHREQLLRDCKLLSTALDNPDDQYAIVRVLRILKHQKLERDLAVVQETAARRSGTRGIKARKELRTLEEEVTVSEVYLTQAVDEMDPHIVSKEVQEAVNLHSELEETLASISHSNPSAKAESILLGLGFPAAKLHAPFTTLSGGWQMRCMLATLLFLPADVLLLDEPTNHLDLPALLWLQSHLAARTGTTIVAVTHDRAFADVVGDELLLLRNCTLEHFRGNLSAYEAERTQQQRRFTRMRDAQERQKSHMAATIAGSVAAARRTGDDKKLKQAASRRKKLEERTGLQVGRTGGRFKLNRDLPGYHNSLREEIEVPEDDAEVRIKLLGMAPELRFPGVLVALEDVRFAYAGGGPEVLRKASLSIHPGQRIGIAGTNGAGKSTIVGLIMAEEMGGGMKPTAGTITRHSQLQVRCFSQKAVEELETLGQQDRSLTALSVLLSEGLGELSEPEARRVLASLGLHGKTVSDVPVASLSGGQKVRLALAKVVWKLSHLLILDEVTTHLDAGTIVALAKALSDYDGALLVITHDRFFMRCVVEGERLDDFGGDDEDESYDESTPRKGTVYRLSKGKLTALKDGMQEYEELSLRASMKLRSYA